MRVAAIDCGTNSIRLLVADVDPVRGALTELDRRLEIVRLGQDVDRTGRLAPEALARTFEACKGYAERISEFGIAVGPGRAIGPAAVEPAAVEPAAVEPAAVEPAAVEPAAVEPAAVEPAAVEPGRVSAGRIRFVATSATRDAANRNEFVAGIREILGVEPEVITGVEEASLSFAGATRELSGPSGATGQAAPSVAAPYLVVDIGGGSTEFVIGDGVPGEAISVDMGCVRLTERYLTDDPPTREQIDAARAETDRLIDRAAKHVPFERARSLVALAGTATTVAAMALDLPRYDPERIHLSRVPAGEIRGIAERFLRMSHDERAALPFMHPGRVDVIGGGALILERIATRLEPHLAGADVVISEHDILDGIAWSAA